MHNMRVIFALITLNAYVRNFVDVPKIFRIAHQGKYNIISLQRNTSSLAPRYSKITYEIFSLYLKKLSSDLLSVSIFKYIFEKMDYIGLTKGEI